MRGILINSTTLGGRTYTYKDISKGIFACAFPQDKFYGGRVTRWGNTANGLLLCLDGFYEIVIDIFVDFAALDELDTKTLRAIDEAVRARKLIYTPAKEMAAAEKALAIPKEKKDLAAYIQKHAIGIISNEPEPPRGQDKDEGQHEDPGGKNPGKEDPDDDDGDETE